MKRPSHPAKFPTNRLPTNLTSPPPSVDGSGVLGDRDRLDVVVAPRPLADIEKATRRHTSSGRP